MIESPPQPPSQSAAAGGGSEALRDPQHRTPAAAPSPAERLLCGIGVRADVAASLAGRDPAQIVHLIAQARARTGVRDLAGWVVSALRALPPTEAATPPPPKVSDLPILSHPGLSHAERQRWLMRFRNAEPAERPDILARLHTEHPLEESRVHAA